MISARRRVGGWVVGARVASERLWGNGRLSNCAHPPVFVSPAGTALRSRASAGAPSSPPPPARAPASPASLPLPKPRPFLTTSGSSRRGTPSSRARRPLSSLPRLLPSPPRSLSLLSSRLSSPPSRPRASLLSRLSLSSSRLSSRSRRPLSSSGEDAWRRERLRARSESDEPESELRPICYLNESVPASVQTTRDQNGWN